MPSQVLIVCVTTSLLAATLASSEPTSSTTASPETRAKLYQCLNSCAMCVEHWEPGLYNGPRCAKQCMKHKGQRIVDPDCVKLKMFNYDPEVLKEHRKFIRTQTEFENTLDE
ncbi:hypothetical protein JTE90_025614 [Oedothorax gibbosus]|uniref:Eclosion hormone n=1 Tax=Oedothorax gibbosus TaxID=931172 RepID=A0AAV6VAC6_9ARAC|nr:hypothetical protein JTE90_025614 [Oedothorax gibbosus]